MSGGIIMIHPGTHFGATEMRKRGLFLLFMLSAVFAASIGIGYYALPAEVAGMLQRGNHEFL